MFALRRSQKTRRRRLARHDFQSDHPSKKRSAAATITTRNCASSSVKSPTATRSSKRSRSDDIRHACDVFRALYDSTGGADGFVSLEVSPLLASDTKGRRPTRPNACGSSSTVPNVMIKIPATPEGISAITETIAKADQRQRDADLLARNLRRRRQTRTSRASKSSTPRVATWARSPPSRACSSAASIRPSTSCSTSSIMKGEKLEGLLGKTGIANLRLTYARFRKIFEAERFTQTRRKGRASATPALGEAPERKIRSTPI